MRQLSALLFYAFIVLFIYSCEVGDISKLTVVEFEEILSNSISEDKFPLDRLSELDPYESFFLARKASDYGYTDTALLLARHCWQNVGGFIGEQAAGLCISLDNENGNLSEAEFYASLAAAEYPDNYSFKRSAAEAEYWQQEDEALLVSLTELDKDPAARKDYELYLFKAVAAFRLDLPDWKDAWISMFINIPSSEYIRRGWDFLTLAYDAPYDEFPVYRELIRAKYLYSSGKYREASAAFSAFTLSEVPEALTEIVINDIEDSFLRSGNKSKGARMLQELGLKHNSGDCLFAAARLYRRAGLNRDASRCIDAMLDENSGIAYTERELWYSFDIKVRSSLTDAVDSLDYYIDRWEDPAFFTDSLENLCNGLAQRRSWGTIRLLTEKLEHAGPAEVYDRCRYISERAAALGYIAKPEVSSPYSSLYYRILSGDALNELRSESAVNTGKETSPGVFNDEEKYIDGLLRYHLDNVLQEIKKHSAQLSESFLIRCAAETAGRGAPLDSIRMMYQYSGELSPAGLMRLYPDLYREEVERNAVANNIPPHLMFGIVWKESGFEKDIVSRSGAVGLSQLMPTTAEDVARRNRRSVADLTDPDENLALGSWYLNWLKGYVGNSAKAVLSYNGGPGRVKGWLKEYSDLPDDLVYEIVPVAETHQYGKKVLTAAVLYGLLYYDIEPAETLRIFF